MSGAVFLRGDRATLRTVERDDVDFVHAEKNRPEVHRSFVWPYPETRVDVEDERTRHGSLGVWVAEPYWGDGYGTEACERIVAYAFAERNLHRVTARVVQGNEGSKRIWETLGFEHEGRLRENQFDDGEYVDTHYFGLLESEWRARDA